MKTICELNERIGYRVTKVIYFGLTAIVFMIGSGVFYLGSIDYSYANKNKARITCVSSRISRDVLKSDYGISGFSLSGDELTLEQKKKMAMDVCHFIPADDSQFTDFVTLFDVQYGLTYLTQNKVITVSESILEDKFQWSYFLGGLAVWVVMLGLLCELVRRVFYYVIFGKFRPAK